MSRIISPEKIAEIMSNNSKMGNYIPLGNVITSCEDVAKAQRDSSDEEWMEFIIDFNTMYWEDFKEKYGVKTIVSHSIDGLLRLAGEWQALKQKVTGEQ